jgi:hypothetical protein
MVVKLNREQTAFTSGLGLRLVDRLLEGRDRRRGV